MKITRRTFNKGLVSLAMSGLASHIHAFDSDEGKVVKHAIFDTTKLIPDPHGMLDLPAGFSYQVISKLGDLMNDGLKVPDRADGMGCIGFDQERVVLIRNHELSPINNPEPATEHDLQIAARAYDSYNNGKSLPGGTSNILFNLTTRKVENQYMSLIGTIRNCAGGKTPWGSWLTCEENVSSASDELKRDHGYVFEVPATAEGLVAPSPIVGMGRFNHEAACVDPKTGIIYLTEDREDSLFYRFIPRQQSNLHAGGKLQALAVKSQPGFDSRNWEQLSMRGNKVYACEWLDLDNVESPEDDLRHRGFNAGAALFARGEGIYFSDDPATQELYFCCTNGGNKKLGQIMRYRPSTHEGKVSENDFPGTLQLFVESDSMSSLNFADNLVISPTGHLIVCEDQYSEVKNNHLKIVTPSGKLFDLANIRWQTEPAGACFSPDGQVMFVNLYSPTATLAIYGPWQMLNMLT